MFSNKFHHREAIRARSESRKVKCDDTHLLVPVLRRQRQAGLSEFGANLVYIVSSR